MYKNAHLLCFLFTQSTHILIPMSLHSSSCDTFLITKCTMNQFNFMETLNVFFCLVIILFRIMSIFVLTGYVDNFDPAVTPTLIFCFTSVYPIVISIDAGEV